MFVKIPNKSKPGENVGCLLSKNYVPEMESGFLSSKKREAEEIFNIAIKDSFWISTKKRVMEKYCIPTINPLNPEQKINLFVTGMIPWGTISGRIVDNITAVMSSPKKNKIGTDLRNKLCSAPDGWKVVALDVDAEEMGIASLYADKYVNEQFGSSPFTYTVVRGNKANFSDSHSALAFNMFLKDRGYIFLDGKWYINTD